MSPLENPTGNPSESLDTQRIDISNLFRQFGFTGRISALFNRHTYEVDPKAPKDNWLYSACCGFQRLRTQLITEGRPTETFASIGTGSGIDGVFAHRIFRPRRIILSDCHEAVTPLADQNARDNIKDDTEIITLTGNLCEPMRERGLKADIIYANLPLIPEKGDVSAGMLSSTFAPSDFLDKAPEEYRRYLLGMKYLFLKDAKDVLTERGSVVVNLGGRVPVDLVKQMFRECGYTYQELFRMFKVQSQPEEVLPGFAKAEARHGIEFDFYFKPFFRPLEFNERLVESRLNAAGALRLHEQGGTVCHIVQVIRGQRI